MLDGLVEIGPEAYATSFFVGLAAVAAAEGLRPRRSASVAQGPRWARNITLSMLDVALVRLVLPAFGISAAILVAQQGWGAGHALAVPEPMGFLAALVALDVGRWLLHYLLHRSRWLWRLHAVHHSDRDYDFSTALRFHPLEALYTALFNVAFIAVLGPPVAAVVVYEIVSGVVGSFAHGNLALPLWVDRFLRRVIVTPDLHRVHHSANDREQMTNFAAVSPVWDRLFGTYQDQPELGHLAMEIGLRDQTDDFSQSLRGMLIIPFQGAAREPAEGSSRRESAGSDVSSGPKLPSTPSP